MKERAARIGLNGSAFSDHSLRAGLATAAARASGEERITMRQTRHRSIQVFRTYQRDGELLTNNLSGRVVL